MSSEQAQLEQQRDQVLRDIVELEEQAADGEIPVETAQRLRAEYEAAAAEILAGLEQRQLDRDQPDPATSTSTIARRTAYAAAGLAAVAVAVLLPRFVEERPQGGLVSGDEAAQAQPSPNAASAPRRDLATVTDEQMEVVITQNPGVVGMRLALAERYLEQGRLNKASEHYGVALKQQPGNPKVLAESGRILFALGKPNEAAEFAARALSIDVSSEEALVLQAEILASGDRDPRGAQALVQQLATRADQDPDTRRRAEQLIRHLERTPTGR